MYNIKQNRGFSLIEIVVVLIILGFLAAIALPSYFLWVQKAKANEALRYINMIKGQLVTCLRAYKGDPNIGCKCISNVYPHEISALTPLETTYYNPDGSCKPYIDDSHPQGRLGHVGTSGSYNSKNFVYWISNQGTNGFDANGYASYNGTSGQSWSIAAYYFPDDATNLDRSIAGMPSSMKGAIQISGDANDNNPIRCNVWGEFIGLC